jgi:hypothetical protein
MTVHGLRREYFRQPGGAFQRGASCEATVAGMVEFIVSLQ